MKPTRLTLNLALLAASLLAAACGTALPVPLTPSPIVMPLSTDTPLPTGTLPPASTLLPSATSLATGTPVPAATSTTLPSTTLVPSQTAPSQTASPASTPNASKLLTGVNLAGADFSPIDKRPGVYGVDYFYPTHAEVDYFTGKGMNVFRLPFNWENLQPQPMADLQADELARLDDIVNYATGKNAQVILDPHNYARYYNKLVGTDVPVAAFADLWRRLADHYKDNPRVIFGLMNEPNSMPTALWLSDANAAIAAIRQTGATNLLLVPGNAWTGAHSWSESWYGTPNATVMLGVVDPLNHYAFDAHQYMDEDSSGTHEDCVSKTIGSERLMTFTAWLKQNHRQAFLGEFAGARNDTCYAALDDMLSYIDQNTDVWLGWTYWAAGPQWGDYLFTLEPDNGTDRPQMAILSKHIGR